MIGAGKMATILSRYFAKAGHKVFIGARDLNQATGLASDIGFNVQGGTIDEAVQQGDIIFLAVPYLQIKDTLKLTGPLKDKIVVDMSNPLKADFSGLLIGGETSAAEELAKLIPDAKVVKAFNCLFATVLERGSEFGPVANSESGSDLRNHRAQIFYAGDDDMAKQQVAELIEDTGFEPLHTGQLISARYQEQLTALVLETDKYLKDPLQITPVMLMRERI